MKPRAAHERFKIAATFLACFLFGAATVRELVTVAVSRGVVSQTAQGLPDLAPLPGSAATLAR